MTPDQLCGEGNYVCWLHRFAKWCKEPAGEFNGIEPYLPHGKVLMWYAILAVELAACAFFAWSVTR